MEGLIPVPLSPLPLFPPKFLFLRVRVSGLAVEVAEVLGLDEVEASLGDAREEAGDLRVRDGRDARLGDEAAAPVVGAEGLGVAAGPDLDAAIADGGQLEAAAAHFRH